VSLTFGFYNSIDGDRKYNALQMSSLFDGIIRDGIFMSIGDCFIVSEVSGMQVKVGTGRAWFNHTWTNNDSELIIDIPVSELILNRIDTVVLEINHSDEIRANSIKVIKGTPSSNPVKPELINDDYVHQYPLCDIYVEHGVTSITQANITNRVGTSDCPFVTGILETVDIDDLLLQWNAEFDDWFNQKIEDVDTLIDNLNSTFQSWFDGIKNTLDGDIVGNLLNLINENADAIVDLNSEIETMNGRMIDMESNIIELESKISSTSSILTEAGEDLLTGNLVSIYQDKLYKLPSKLTPVTNISLGMRTTSPVYSVSVPLDGNKVLVAYNNYSTGYPVVATFSVTDSDITADSNALVLSNNAINSIVIVKIAYNKYVILYSVSNASSYAQIITITDNNTIVAETAVTILTSTQRMLKAVLLEDNKIFVVGSSSSSHNSSYAQVLTISGSTITKGMIVSWVPLTNSAYGRDLIKLDNSRVLFAYDYDQSYVLPFSVSGTTITKGTAVQISSAGSSISLYALDSDRVLASYKGTTYFELKILTVTDLTVDTSANSVVTTNAAYPFISKFRFSDTEIIGVQNAVGVMKVTVSGTTITSMTTLMTDIFPSFFLTPFKMLTLTLSSSAQATCTIVPYQMYDATGYVISDTGIYNNTKKAAYVKFDE